MEFNRRKILLGMAALAAPLPTFTLAQDLRLWLRKLQVSSSTGC